MIELLLLFPALMLLGTVTYQMGRRAGREEQRRADLWVGSRLWLGGREKVVFDMTMSSDGSGHLSWLTPEEAERRWRVNR